MPKMDEERGACMLRAHDPPLRLAGQLLGNLRVQFRCIGVDRRVAEQRGIEPA